MEAGDISPKKEQLKSIGDFISEDSSSSETDNY